MVGQRVVQIPLDRTDRKVGLLDDEGAEVLDEGVGLYQARVRQGQGYRG